VIEAGAMSALPAADEGPSRPTKVQIIGDAGMSRSRAQACERKENKLTGQNQLTGIKIAGPKLVLL
jgi:hypothetical protein